MFDNIKKIISKVKTNQNIIDGKSKDAAKERLHLVLMQDRANVSADFLDLMKQEIIDVIKKYIDVDEKSIDVRLTNKANADGTMGCPALYANIPIIGIKNEIRKQEEMHENIKLDSEFLNNDIIDELNNIENEKIEIKIDSMPNLEIILDENEIKTVKNKKAIIDENEKDEVDKKKVTKTEKTTKTTRKTKTSTTKSKSTSKK